MNANLAEIDHSGWLKSTISYYVAGDPVANQRISAIQSWHAKCIIARGQTHR